MQSLKKNNFKKGNIKRSARYWTILHFAWKKRFNSKVVWRKMNEILWLRRARSNLFAIDFNTDVGCRPILVSHIKYVYNANYFFYLSMCISVNSSQAYLCCLPSGIAALKERRKNKDRIEIQHDLHNNF